ncbi:GatB/YqeY domain-containing protein [Sessilibacter corallicola]|uniref:GatB/YqeY domain-containing protein n=1 Tax=Sessilibacter corallicola TaxID=2904075 RepID=A0ABQ0A5D4_9GAMM|nr:GatB/YqeY domain-containing protein [Sessilibacter corallicola]MCE2027576.1 GatB/YqeY domain-containing protein [Sessilibacter corallicola]
MASELYTQIKNGVKEAMRSKNKERLSTLRLIQAEFKRIEVDERIELDDARILVVLDKMCKQRRDSINQFKDAGRDDLAEQEQKEVAVITEFLPAALSEDEIDTIVTEAIAESGAASPQDMGKVMALVKPKVQGRGDMGLVSKLVKSKLS